jgi:FkbH-like protein
LRDKFGDNGIISLLVGKRTAKGDLEMDTWLMSCRVLGRHVEEASLNLVVAGARELGLRSIVGEYRPTSKNGIVKDMYERLGFSLIGQDKAGISRWALAVDSYTPRQTHIRALEVVNAGV